MYLEEGEGWNAAGPGVLGATDGVDVGRAVDDGDEKTGEGARWSFPISTADLERVAELRSAMDYAMRQAAEVVRMEGRWRQIGSHSLDEGANPRALDDQPSGDVVGIRDTGYGTQNTVCGATGRGGYGGGSRWRVCDGSRR